MLDIRIAGLAPDFVPYQEGWELQRGIHREVVSGDRPDTLLLLEHEAVYTAGKRTEPHERPQDGTPVIDVDRGGKITWHGPGQLVGYPIIKLPSRVGVVDHVRRMEQAVINLLAELGIESSRVEGRTGVWLAAAGGAPVTATGRQIWDSATPDSASTPPVVAGPAVPLALQNVISVPARPERKICAIGIRVARRTTMHGFAINVTNGTAAFENIIPCGISDAGVTSIAGELGAAPSLPELARMLEPHLARCLDYSRALSDVLAGV